MSNNDFGNWTSVNFELPSQAEYDAQGGGDKFADDTLDDGVYTFQITDISPRLPSNPQYDPEDKKDRRAFTLTVVASDDPADVGKRITMYAGVSAHPKSTLYPFFKAAYGGYFDPQKRPNLIDLKDAQFKATVTHTRKPNKDGIMREYTNVNAPFAVKQRVPYGG